jgi:hypothetical protein
MKQESGVRSQESGVRRIKENEEEGRRNERIKSFRVEKVN